MHGAAASGRVFLQRCRVLSRQLKAVQAEKEEISAELQQWVARSANGEAALQHAIGRATAAEAALAALQLKYSSQKLQVGTAIEMTHKCMSRAICHNSSKSKSPDADPV
ncbi:hypothetical protein cyc_01710 [Cyclospora cayetanensis]|uniref:Uncharacterized protein n=1 Tax=Cyclospora cayetanensis TaxID=88456 RepID=A0A1D3D7A3_9EIME|nr:hypothetical protein cyc_01710 [Cyclospora cayetanensis]